MTSMEKGINNVSFYYGFIQLQAKKVNFFLQLKKLPFSAKI